MRAVAEVPELSLPQGQRIGISERIAILITEHRLLREERVDHLVGRLACADMVQRRVALAGRLVNHVAVALHESAAADILAGQAHREAFVEQAGKREMLRAAPVDFLAGLVAFAAAREHALDGLVDINAVRHAGNRVAEFLELGFRDARPAAPVVIDRQAEAGPVAFQPVGLVGLQVFGGSEGLLEEFLELLDLSLDLFGRQKAFGDEALAIDFAGRRKVLNHLVHDRLGHRRIVAFVVTEAAIAEHVDDHVLRELLTVLGRNLCGIDDGFRIIPVDVEDRRLDSECHIRRIRRGARIHRARGEADLVVDDEVDRAAGAVALEAREGEAFSYDALPREGRIAMQQQGHLRRPVELALLARFRELLSARTAKHDRVHSFKVRGVGTHGEVDRIAVKLAVRRGAEVVFHIPRAERTGALRGAALELMEDLVIALAHHGGEHVQAAAVRHADDDLVDAERAAALDDLLQRRHGGFAAIETEAFGAREALVQEALKGFRFDQLAEDRKLAFAGERDALVRAFDPFLQPGFLGGIGNMHELDAERRAIGALQDLQHLVDGGALEAEHVVDEDRTVAVFRLEAVSRGVEFGLFAEVRQAQRIELSG